MKTANQRADELIARMKGAVGGHPSGPSAAEGFIKRICAGGGVKTEATRQPADRQLAQRAGRSPIDAIDRSNQLATDIAAKKNKPHKNQLKGGERSLADSFTEEGFQGSHQEEV